MKVFATALLLFCLVATPAFARGHHHHAKPRYHRQAVRIVRQIKRTIAPGMTPLSVEWWEQQLREEARAR